MYKQIILTEKFMSHVNIWPLGELELKWNCNNYMLLIMLQETKRLTGYIYWS